MPDEHVVVAISHKRLQAISTSFFKKNVSVNFGLRLNVDSFKTF